MLFNFFKGNDIPESEIVALYTLEILLNPAITFYATKHNAPPIANLPLEEFLSQILKEINFPPEELSDILTPEYLSHFFKQHMPTMNAYVKQAKEETHDYSKKQKSDYFIATIVGEPNEKFEIFSQYPSIKKAIGSPWWKTLSNKEK